MIGSSLEAQDRLSRSGTDLSHESLADLAEIYIVSEVVPGEGEDDRGDAGPTIVKCGRCWRLLPEVAEDGGLCARCEGVVNG